MAKTLAAIAVKTRSGQEIMNRKDREEYARIAMEVRSRDSSS